MISFKFFFINYCFLYFIAYAVESTVFIVLISLHLKQIVPQFKFYVAKQWKSLQLGLNAVVLKTKWTQTKPKYYIVGIRVNLFGEWVLPLYVWQ